MSTFIIHFLGKNKKRCVPVEKKSTLSRGMPELTAATKKNLFIPDVLYQGKRGLSE